MKVVLLSLDSPSPMQNCSFWELITFVVSKVV